MKMRIYAAPTLCLVIALATGRAAYSQAPAAASTPTTIWNFLGIPQGVNKIRDATVNRRGNFPGLERQPPLKAIADPANLVSGVPSMEAAAEIKQAEDLKKQKIKAIKYLATIGCGCYDKDKKITKAIIASMEDCTEEVRLAAVEAVLTAAENKECAQCHSACCCGKEVVEKLSQIAYERDDTGCFIEPSERVRAAAIEALAACCPNRLPLSQVETLPPAEAVEGEEVIPGTLPGTAPEGEVPPIPAPATPAPSSPSDAPAGVETSAPASGTAMQWTTPPVREVRATTPRVTSRPASSRHVPSQMVSSRRRFQSPAAPVAAPTPMPAELDELEPPSMNAIFENHDEEPAPPQTPARFSAASTRQVSARRAYRQATPMPAELPVEAPAALESAMPVELPHAEPASPVLDVARGHIQQVDLDRGMVTVHLHGEKQLAPGSVLKVYHEYLTGRTSLTKLEVVYSAPGIAHARATEPGKLNKIARGDDVVGW